jgi:hypothetical protein
VDIFNQLVLGEFAAQQHLVADGKDIHVTRQRECDAVLYLFLVGIVVFIEPDANQGS